MKRFCICSLLIPPKRFDIFSPITGGCSEGLGVVLFFFKNQMFCIWGLGNYDYNSDMYGHHIKQSMDQPGKIANNPAHGQLNRENNIPLSPCVPENLVLRDGFSRPVPRQPAHLHTQAESGAYLRDSSRVPRRRPFMKPPYAIGSVPSLLGRAIAYRWRSVPRVRRHKASKPQGSSERVLP